MKWNKDLNRAPLDTTLEFCDPDGDVYQGEAHRGQHDTQSYVRALTLDSHGCGCCGGGDPLPIAWRHPAPAPSWLKK